MTLVFLVTCQLVQLQLGVAAISPAETMKEHRSQQFGRLFTSGLHGGARLIAQSAPVLFTSSAVGSSASAVFLRPTS